MKRIFGAAFAAMMVLALFAGCDTEPQEVKVVGFAQAGAPSNVKAVQTTDKNYIIVYWDASKDGESYNVYVQQKDKKTHKWVSEGNNSFSYSTTDGTYRSWSSSGGYVYSTNTDADKWSARIGVGSITTVLNSSSEPVPAGTYRFGVSAESTSPEQQNSDIKWSDYITVANP